MVKENWAEMLQCLNLFCDGFCQTEMRIKKSVNFAFKEDVLVAFVKIVAELYLHQKHKFLID